MSSDPVLSSEDSNWTIGCSTVLQARASAGQDRHIRWGGCNIDCSENSVPTHRVTPLVGGRRGWSVSLEIRRRNYLRTESYPECPQSTR